MPVVFIIAEDWKLRAAVRAELRERGINALGMDSISDAGKALAAGEMPTAVVLDADAKAVEDPAIQKLANRVPTVLIASRTRAAPAISAAKTLLRPVRIVEIVATLLDVLRGERA